MSTAAPAPAPGPTIAERLAVAEDFLQSTVEVASWSARQIEAHAERITALEELVKQLTGLLMHQQRELGQLRPQVAGLEEREGRRSAPVVLADPTAEELATARSIVEEVRGEHERFRARHALISSYEERLRRVESR